MIIVCHFDLINDDPIYSRIFFTQILLDLSEKIIRKRSLFAR